MPCVVRRRLRAVESHLLASNPTSAGCALPATGATVCVTGASGFVGSWLVKKLLERGHAVRACVRNVDDEAKVGFLKAMPGYAAGKLTLHAADMTQRGAYDLIFEGCHTVFHPAEVFMTFVNTMASQGFKAAVAKVGVVGKLGEDTLHNSALTSSEYLVESINKSTTVRRLVYTSSTSSILNHDNMAWMEAHPKADETLETEAADAGAYSYSTTKRETELYFAFEAGRSGGKWDTLTGNPGDIVGPILSPHQAGDSWVGKIGAVLAGGKMQQEAPESRPFLISDVRDIAENEIRLAESPTVLSGSRFILLSGTLVQPAEIGVRIMSLFPKFQCTLPSEVLPMEGAKEVVLPSDVWLQFQPRNDKVVAEVGAEFHSFRETLRDMVDSLISVGGVQPSLKK